MSDLRGNTIIGTLLASALAVLGLRYVVGESFHSEFPKKAGYEVDISAMTANTGGGGEAPKEVEGPVDWGRLLADPALVAQGEKITAKCASCHDFTSGGPNKTGPNLYGVVGRAAGTHPGFTYSASMKAYAQPWTYDNINKFVTAPGKDVKGTLMTFAGLKKQDERTAVIAYLRSLAPSPAPLPAPLPEPAAAPVAPAAGAPAKPPG